MPTNEQPKPNHLLVAVLTTSGTFPSSGSNEVPEHQPVKDDLAAAARALKLTSTAGWIATVGGQKLNVNESYLQNHLTGTVEIDWGPPEGGGGAAR